MSTEKNTDLLTSLDERMRGIALKVMMEQESFQKPIAAESAEAVEVRARLQIIMAKEFISVPEAALLLNCSDSHIRNLIQKAMSGRAEHPIPYNDLDGVQTLHRPSLLTWAQTPKGARPRRKDKLKIAG